jgi:hypothetical protein
MSDQSNYQSTFNLSLNDQKSCEGAIRNGGIAAFVSAGFTAIFATMGFFAQPKDNQLGFLMDPWLFLDVGLVILLGIFTLRKNRVASTILFIYFIFSKILLLMNGLGSTSASGLLPSVFFFLFFLNAMRATYIWHAKYVPSVKEPSVST